MGKGSGGNGMTRGDRRRNARRERLRAMLPRDGAVIGALAGLTALAVNDEKPPGWANRINTVAAWLALIGFFSLLIFYTGQHGWWMGGGLCKNVP